jgi:hypothetical protein
MSTIMLQFFDKYLMALKVMADTQSRHVPSYLAKKQGKDGEGFVNQFPTPDSANKTPTPAVGVTSPKLKEPTPAPDDQANAAAQQQKTAEEQKAQQNLNYVTVLEEIVMNSLKILNFVFAKKELLQAAPIDKYLGSFLKLLKKRRFIKIDIKILCLECIRSIITIPKNQEYLTANEGVQIIMDLAKNKKGAGAELHKVAMDVLKNISYKGGIFSQLSDGEMDGKKSGKRTSVLMTVQDDSGVRNNPENDDEEDDEDQLVTDTLPVESSVQAPPIKGGNLRSKSTTVRRNVRNVRVGRLQPLANQQAHPAYLIYAGGGANMSSKDMSHNKSFV